MESHRVGHDWNDLAAAAACFIRIKKKMRLWSKPVGEYRIPMINTDSKLHIKVYFPYKYQFKLMNIIAKDLQLIII